jgi:site-specific recombinase XerD
MTGADERQVIDLTDAQRLWAAHLDSLAGQDRAPRPAVTATLRRFLSGLAAPDDPQRLVVDKRTLWQWLTDDAKGRSTRYLADRLAIVNDFLTALVAARLLDANPLTEYRPCYGQPSWCRLARALQANDPEAAVASLQTAPRPAGPLDANIRAYLDLHRSLGKKCRSHATALRSLDRFLQARAVPSPQAIDRAAIEQWLAGLAVSAYTRGRKAQILHCFFDHLRSESIVALNPVPVMERLPGSSFKPFIFTKEQLVEVLEAIRRMPDGCRAPHTYFTMLALLATLGLRLGEVRRLRLCDIDLERQALFIERTKFHKSRYVPFGAQVAQCLQRYLQARRQVLLPVQEDDPVFTTKWRKPVYPLTLMIAFRKTLSVLGIQGTPGQGAPRLHDLRHTFAVHRLLRWYREGVDVQSRLPLLATFMGHIEPRSTEVYLTMTMELLQEANTRFHRHFGRVFDEEDLP